MKNKITLVTVLISASLLASAPALARGPSGGSRGSANTSRGSGSASCDLSGPGQGTPVRDGSGKVTNNRGNPNSTGTPLRDGSGKATAPGQGPKDGTGNNANCPVPTPPSK